MIIVDSHCHLDMLHEHDSLENILKRAADSGVKYLQTICTKVNEIDKILQIAELHDNIFASVGQHPSEVKEVIGASELLDISKHDKIIGIGETGLDYFYNKDLKHQENQRKSFSEHILASQENNLPVIIHTRGAEEDTKNIIAEHNQDKSFPGLIHCFTASKEFAKEMLDLGMYISISGIVTFKNAADLQEAARYIPLDRMLVETDSPYLAPVPKRGKTNEPSYTRYVAEFIADLKSVPLQEVAEVTTNNFFELFSKAKK